ncbi:MAG: DUF3365 domain-containing protein [Cuspidothrix sp.]
MLMKQLQTRLTLIMFSIFFAGWTICGLSIWGLEYNDAKKEIIRKATLLLDTAAATRDYTSTQVVPQFSLLTQEQSSQNVSKSADKNQEVPEFNKVTVPSYAAQQILNQLGKSKENKGYTYRESAINPTNRKDLAVGWEVEIIDYFAKNPNIKDKIGERLDVISGHKTLYIAKPIKITKSSCLVCHSKPENAPPSLIKTYGSENGFGWKMNEIVGTRIISVPTSVQYQEAQNSVGSYLLAIASVFLIAYTTVVLVIQKWIIRPLDGITHLVEEISLHQLEMSQLPEDKSNSLNPLNKAINRLLISLNKALEAPKK